MFEAFERFGRLAAAVTVLLPSLAAAHPATEWAKAEFAEYTAKVFGRVPEARFVLPGETSDFADDFKALKGTDGYAVRTRGGTLYFIADNPKGFVNGVHRWLERISDIIWPRPAGDLCFFTPQSNSRTIEQSNNYRDIPAFRQRIFGYASLVEGVLRWRTRNAYGTLLPGDGLGGNRRTMYEKYGIYGVFDDAYGYIHDMERLWVSRKEYLSTHPEYFMFHNGRRGTGPSCNFCETNPDLPKIFAQRILDAAKTQPKSVTTMVVCMEDTSLTCTCEACLRPLVLADGTTVAPDDPAFKSTRFFRFFNKIARLVAAERPDLRLRQLAYQHLAVAPRERLEPNIEILYCPFPRNMKESIAKGVSNREWRERIERWLACSTNVSIYEYWYDGAEFPRPVNDTIAEDLRWFVSRGIRAVQTEAPDRLGDRREVLRLGSETPEAWFFDMSGIEAWVTARLCWDPRQDPAALRTDYLRRTFGPAAGAVGEFYRLVHEAWDADPTPSRYDDNVFRTAARTLVKAGIADRCRAALARAETLADVPARRQLVSDMRATLETWIVEASNYEDMVLTVPRDPREGVLTLPTLRVTGTRRCYDVSRAVFRLRVVDGTLEVSLTIPRPYVEGESADVSFADDGGSLKSFPLRVTCRASKSWAAAVRVPLAELPSVCRTGASFRVLPRVGLKDGVKASVLDFSWLGGRPGRPETWGRMRLAAPKAQPDGTDETARWQAAIDAAARKGGGRVNVPAGRHFIGQLDLRSNVELHLEEGAVLEALPDRSLYRFVTLPFSEGDWSAILFAQNVTNVAVTGKGEIFGNGSVWLIPSDYTGMIEGIRPRGLFFADSKDIRLEDFTLRDAPCWGVVLKRCDGVTARRVVIDSHVNHNNDGFDVEAKNVLIEDCLADAGDDAFCIKSNDPDFTVEHVRVRNCTARSQCNGYKLGTASHGTMRDIRFEHCRAEPPTRLARETKLYEPLFGEPLFLRPGFDGFAAGVGLGAITIENVDGGVVEDISATDFEVSGFHVPVFVRAGRRRGRKCGIPPSDKCVFRNVTVENVRGRAESVFASSVSGVDACRVQNVTLRNVTIACRGAGVTESERARTMKVPDRSERYPECTMFRPSILPAYGLYADRVDGLRLENVNFTLQEGTVDVRPPVFIEPTVTDVERK